MPRPEILDTRRPVTRPELVSDLRRLGVPAGTTVMVHAAMSALGWVVGGSQAVVEALLEVVGPQGTICCQASWEDIPFGIERWPARWRDAYESELPAFDPSLSAAAPYEGRIPERIRTWPGACRSANPATGVVAVGAGAAELTKDHRLDDGFGAGTPYARLVDGGGHVLLLGAPLHAISLLHHAEAVAAAPKRWTTYGAPLLRDGRRRWVEIREIDVWRGVFPYERVSRDPPLEVMAAAALAAGVGQAGKVGCAEAYRFPAAPLTAFAVGWLERRFARPSTSRSTISC